MRVALLFAAASIAVLAVVFVLRQKLGLPDWVLAGAAALLVIGLPIMLVTGRKERERVIAAATGTYRVPDAGVAKHFTWRKAILGGGLAFGTLVAIVIGYTVMRALGIGSIGTLQAKGLIKDRQPILLAEFENRAPDSTLGPTLTEALRVDLSQSETVKLLDGEAVGGALTRMQKPATTVLTPVIARELAQREGVPAIVEGEIDPVGKSYVISAKVISAANGSSLTALRETAASDAELIPAIDRLSRALRERIGESLVTIRADEPLEHVTTSSLDALRKYSQARRLSDAGREDDAIPLLQEATTIDSSFAMAWRKLAVILSNHGAPYTKIADAAGHAYRHRDHLSELEKQSGHRLLRRPGGARSAQGSRGVPGDAGDRSGQHHRTQQSLAQSAPAAPLRRIGKSRGQMHEKRTVRKLSDQCDRCPVGAGRGAARRQHAPAMGAPLTGRPEHEGRSRAGAHVAS